MRNLHLPLLSLLGLSVFAVSPVAADTLIVEGLEAAQATRAERPARGMTMDQVTRRWGEPTGRDAAVGEPPITRWSYAGFVVYFEHQHVVHTVTSRS